MKITAIIGSNRSAKTTSDAIVNYLVQKDLTGQTVWKIYRAREIFQTGDKLLNFMEDIKDSDYFLVSTPVYVHSLPYPLISVMEQMAHFTECHRKKMLAVIHCGYPEDVQRKVSFDICESFAGEAGMHWIGGVGYGASPLINGTPLMDAGIFTKWMRRSLDMVWESLSSGNEITAEITKTARKHFPPIPIRILKTLMNMKMKYDYRKTNLYVKPYSREEFH